MAELTVYRLTFRDGFHLGVKGVNLEESRITIPSDSLFAALLEAFIGAGGDAEGFVGQFQDRDPPFLLSSAFPFAGNVLFLPVAVPLERWFALETLRRRSKDLKRVAFVSKELFRQMLEGEPMDRQLFPEDDGDLTEGLALQGGKFWLSRKEANDLPQEMQVDSKTRKPIPLQALWYHRVYASHQVPRVTVDRVSSASNIFHAGRVSFHTGCGLWFGIYWRKPEAPISPCGTSVQEAVRQALSILGDEGLGGERAVGYGGFRWQEMGSLEVPEPAANGLMWLLSRYHPRDGELPNALTGSPGYTLTAVSGWLRTWQGASQRRKRLWLVTEGSLVRTVDCGPWGDLSDVRPSYRNPAGDIPHPVWRYGLALGAGVKEGSHG